MKKNYLFGCLILTFSFSGKEFVKSDQVTYVTPDYCYISFEHFDSSYPEYSWEAKYVWSYASFKETQKPTGKRKKLLSSLLIEKKIKKFQLYKFGYPVLPIGKRSCVEFMIAETLYDEKFDISEPEFQMQNKILRSSVTRFILKQNNQKYLVKFCLFKGSIFECTPTHSGIYPNREIYIYHLTEAIKPKRDDIKRLKGFFFEDG